MPHNPKDDEHFIIEGTYAGPRPEVLRILGCDPEKWQPPPEPGETEPRFTYDPAKARIHEGVPKEVRFCMDLDDPSPENETLYVTHEHKIRPV